MADRIQTFVHSMRNVEYRASGKPEKFVHGDCQDLCAWFSEDIMGWPMKAAQTSSDMTIRALCKYWGRQKLDLKHIWYGWADIIAAWAMPEVRTRRRPMYVYMQKSAGPTPVDRHMFVVYYGRNGRPCAINLSPGGVTHVLAEDNLKLRTRYLVGDVVEALFPLIDIDGSGVQWADVIKILTTFADWSVTAVLAPGRWLG